MATSILFLAAEPTDAARLRLGEEVREIAETLQRSPARDSFTLEQRFSVRPADISQALLELNPRIVHFSGHATASGELCVEDASGRTKPVAPEALARLFAQFANRVSCVVLNACHTAELAAAISKHINYVIGMSTDIGDRAAIAFSTGFYQALAAGRSIEDAYKFGCVRIWLEGIPEHLIPTLSVKEKGALEYSDDVVLLVGAGVSNYLGLPNLDRLLEQAVIGRDEVAYRIINTRNVIETMHKDAKARFEELVSRLRLYLDVAEMLRRERCFIDEMGGPLPHGVEYGDFQRKWWDALTRCYRIILDEYGPHKIDRHSVEFATVVELLRSLAVANANKLHVYTTNYDCSFQVLAATCPGLVFYSHINNTDGAFTKEWSQANPELEAPDQPAIYVHRFHGCVAWFANPNVAFGVEEVYGAGGGLEIRDDNKLHDMVIKMTPSQSVSPALSLAHEEFSEHLRRTKLLLVWGYSFRDLEVLRCINDALAAQPRLNILYLDPYLPRQQVLAYIRNTLSIAPITIDPRFRPAPVDWKPNDGHDQLIKKTVAAVAQAITATSTGAR